MVRPSSTNSKFVAPFPLYFYWKSKFIAKILSLEHPFLGPGFPKLPKFDIRSLKKKQKQSRS